MGNVVHPGNPSITYFDTSFGIQFTYATSSKDIIYLNDQRDILFLAKLMLDDNSKQNRKLLTKSGLAEDKQKTALMKTRAKRLMKKTDVVLV